MRADLAYYKSCEDLEDLTEEEVKELGDLLRARPVRKAVGKILERVHGIPEQLAQISLLDNAGIQRAIELQAQYRACIQLFDDLLTQAGIGTEEIKT